MVAKSLLCKSLALGWLVLSTSVLAQQTPATPAPTQKPSEAPPKLEVIEAGSDTPITVAPRKQGGAKISEKKVGGVVTEVKVQSGKSSYTMKPNTPAGNAHPGDGQSSALRAPQWTVMEFDLGKKKKTDKDEVTEQAPVPPPPRPAK